MAKKGQAEEPVKGFMSGGIFAWLVVAICTVFGIICTLHLWMLGGVL